jgi:predicted phosphodiesterase
MMNDSVITTTAQELKYLERKISKLKRKITKAKGNRDDEQVAKLQSELTELDLRKQTVQEIHGKERETALSRAKNSR